MDYRVIGHETLELDFGRRFPIPEGFCAKIVIFINQKFLFSIEIPFLR